MRNLELGMQILLVYYAIWSHMHPNISTCTRKVIESIYDTRKIVGSKDITEEIARMMVLDLRPFDIVGGVDFNELFILVILVTAINSRISKFSNTRHDPEEILCSRLDITHLYITHCAFSWGVAIL